MSLWLCQVFLGAMQNLTTCSVLQQDAPQPIMHCMKKRLCTVLNLPPDKFIDVLWFLYQWVREHNFLLKSPHLSWFWRAIPPAFSTMSSPDWRVLVCSATLCAEAFGHPCSLLLHVSQLPSVSETKQAGPRTVGWRPAQCPWLCLSRLRF